MKKKLLACLAFLSPALMFAQPTWSEHAAEVVYNNCTQCHNPSGIAPVSFLDYETAYDYRALIQSYVEFNIMPPWTADSSFQHYFGERILTEYERNTLIEWASSGAPLGDPELAPPPPVYTGEQVLPGVPDLVAEMPMYMSKATELYDDYVCISIPTGLTEAKKIKAVEVIPGNRSIVHHCLVYIDPDGTYETDTIGGDCGGPTSDAALITGYTPGASPTIFPASEDFSMGMVLGEGSNIVLAMHYPHGSYGQFDQTKVNIYFYDEPVHEFREILAGAFLQNWDFVLPPNELTPVEASFEDVPFNLTVLSAFPHMHLLGGSVSTFAIDPVGDTIPFVRIPRWDFDWQDFYWFRYMQKLPFGSDLHAKGVFDNTTANPHNPSDPPVTVFPGFNTTDEMFLMYFHITEYWPGDELVNVDSLNTIFLHQSEEFLPDKNGIAVFPNPFDVEATINYTLTESAHVGLYIYDFNGRLVKRLVKENQKAGEQSAKWDGTTEEGGVAAAGVYAYSMMINGKHYSGRLIKQ